MSIVDISAQCNCVCTCGGKTKLVKAEQDRRLIHFLMGLNEMYTAVRGNIFMMNTLPSSKGPKTNFNSNKGNTGGYGNSNTNVFRRNSSTGRSSLFCDFCKKTGHTKDRCYKLHGYPTNSKFSKGKSANSVANVCASEVDRNQCEDQNDLSKQMPLNLSKGQYEQLLNLLGSLHANHGTNNSENMLSGALNLAGILACYSSITDISDLSCKCVRLTVGSWIIDSGASHHMAYNKATLTNISTLPYPFLITLPNGYKVKVTEIGDVCLNPVLTLRKVMFVPSFKFNLISVHCLALQLKGVVSFNTSSCLLQAPSLKSPLELSRANNGLYFLCAICHNCHPPSGGSKKTHVTAKFFLSHNSHSLVNCTKSSTDNVCQASSSSSTVKYTPYINKEVCSVSNSASCSNVAYSPAETYTDEFLWHARLGHVPFVKMKSISTIPIHFSTKQPFTCAICPMARQPRMPFPESTTSTTKAFELLHIDL
ncbi:hypothetical protein KY290_011451 [Solanum tuberosum]|uniref:Retrovirus-related Pol polyprotein from transposon TNT 1-94-like beta-barrel domain-containing protein n=1 Tax=Solanum tuberosum TaxID=4113 RepID=A0ABQ7W2U1_SOLTU|nr:hypothetical protein KY290_011451 [Solanum tuberosum]